MELNEELVIAKIKECIEKNSGYVNLDTNRVNQDSTVKRKKPKYVNRKYRFFSESLEKYQNVDSLLSMDDELSMKLKELSISSPTNEINKDVDKHPQPKSKKGKRRGKKKYRVDPKKGIPADVRYAVWRKYCKGSFDGFCFCCNIKISFEKWHCGHIKPRARGGSIDIENLRPICIDCNLKMSAMHMYEYILLHNLYGVKHLPSDDKIVRFYQSSVDGIKVTNERLDKLVVDRQLTARQADIYRRQVVSKRKSLSERVTIMEEISMLYIQKVKIH